MIWARLICLGIVAAVALFVRWVADFCYQQELATLWIVVSLPFAAAALITFALSFIKGERQGNRLLVSRDNAYIRFAIKFWGEPEKKITVCGLFWMTVMLLAVGTFVVFIIGFFAYGIYQAIIGNAPQHAPMTMRDVVCMILIFVSALVAFAGLSVKQKDTENITKLGWVVGITGIVLIFSDMAFLLPLWTIVDEQHTSILGALPVYWEKFKSFAPGFLAAVGILIGGLAAVVGLVIGLFRGIKSLRTTLIGRILEGGWQAFKSRTCPIVSVIEENKADVPPTPQ